MPLESPLLGRFDIPSVLLGNNGCQTTPDDIHIPVKSTDFGGSLPIFWIFLPSYHQPTDLPQSTDFYRFFRGSTEF